MQSRGQAGEMGVFSLIEGHLQEVRGLIEEQLSDCSEPARKFAAYVNSSRGKMVRPAMVLLSGLACGRVVKKHIIGAAIIETIHSATLLHDDVIDEGKSRRGIPTLNSIEGNESAVLLGDFLLSRVLRMCTELDNHVAGAIASAAAKTCEGELRQIAHRGNWRLSEREYIEIITDKSAALFSGACLLGAILAGASRAKAQMLAEYGRNIGVAFQITDDLLDLTGEEARTGKAGGNDLDRNKLTLPLIHFMRTANGPDRQAAEEILCQQGRATQRAQLLKRLAGCGSIDYARGRAEEFASRAIGALEGLKDGQGKEALVRTARFVVTRTG